jgi:hypothetical protein
VHFHVLLTSDVHETEWSAPRIVSSSRGKSHRNLHCRCCESPGKGLDVRAELVSAVEIQDSVCVVSRFMELTNSGLSRCAEPSILCTNS